MTLLKYFLLAFLLSAIGTIPIGLITLTIAQKTITKGKRAGWQVAWGATIMEFIYTLLALYGLDAMSLENSWNTYMKMGTFLLFLILGIYYLSKSSSKPQKVKHSNQQIDFFQGVGVGMMNVLIVPFWLVIGLWLKSNGLTFEYDNEIFSFSIGSALGALFIFGVYVEGSLLLLSKSQKITKYTDKIIGSLFVGLALFQLIQLLLI